MVRQRWGRLTANVSRSVFNAAFGLTLYDDKGKEVEVGDSVGKVSTSLEHNQ